MCQHDPSGHPLHISSLHQAYASHLLQDSFTANITCLLTLEAGLYDIQGV